MSSAISKEFGQYSDDEDNDLVSPSHQQRSLELDDYDSSFRPIRHHQPHKKSLLYYLATIQAFLIIYRTEVTLSSILAISLGIGIIDFVSHHTATAKRRGNVDPFRHAHITTDYADIRSKYDLTLGKIDHWCFADAIHGENDNLCSCEDPLEPSSRSSSHKWSEQHRENIKVVTEVLMKTTADLWDTSGYTPGMYDDLWLDRADDDWVWGKGARFGNDDYGLVVNEEDDMYDYDDGFGIPMEAPGDTNGDAVEEEGGGGVLNEVGGERALEDEYELDVVFVGDSITEQRQGTSMGKEDASYIGIKEVFDKTFTKAKGGEFNGIALGIAGDTAPNLLWRLMNGEMPYGLNPKVWWVHIGINDLSMKGCSEEVVLLGILRVVEEIQNSRPNDIIVINSLLPVKRNEDGLLEHTGKHQHEHKALNKKEQNLDDSEMSSKRMHVDLWPSIVSINEELSKFASKHQGIKFFDADQVFVEERDGDKVLKLDLMHDAVHPNLSGHKKWNNAIKKRLHSILDGKE